MRRSAASWWTSRAFVFAAFTLAAFVCGWVLNPYVSRHNAQATQPDTVLGLLPEPVPLRAFGLRTPRGHPFGLGNLRGHMTLIAAGYTSCPDICPATLSVLRDTVMRWQDEAVAGPGPDATSSIQVAFLSVDPVRDSPERLATYLEYFGDRFVGLTGTDEEIQELGHQIGLRYERQPLRQDGRYSVDHTTSIAIVDDRARLVAILPRPHDADRLIGVLRRYTSEIP